MIESMRAHGYSLPTAIADLIDNSVAADASNVWLRFEWSGDESWISLSDDGQGMTEEELVNAMRLGSRSPLDQRDKNDLGRFGLGLKTASFSQARRLTVVTRQEASQTHLRRWDLDHLARPDVEGWQLLRSLHPGSPEQASALDESIPSGTLVLLEVLDRVVGGTSDRDKDREDHFLWQIEQVRQHLAMVFHRFLSKRKPRIYLNEEEIQPWDPFLEAHKATQSIGPYDRRLGANEVPVRAMGFVLPHRDRFESAEEHRAAGGPSGWNAQQGFYVYRNERLIIAGDWLQLRWQKEEHFKLARIRIDIPNSMDHEWQIDVKKSTAIPPAVLRAWLIGIAQNVRKSAKEVYAHRGKYGARKKKNSADHTRPWIALKTSDGEFSYRIDRKHVVLEPLIGSLSESGKAELEALLRLIEETVPVQRIWIDAAENQDGAALPFSNTPGNDMRKLILLCHKAQVQYRGVPDEEAWGFLADCDAFQGTEAQAILGQLREEPL